MWQCNNCEAVSEEIIPAGTLEITEQGVLPGNPQASRYKRVIGYICPKCVTNVLTLKLVLKRANPKEELQFEQYLPVESAK